MLDSGREEEERARFSALENGEGWGAKCLGSYTNKATSFLLFFLFGVAIERVGDQLVDTCLASLFHFLVLFRW